MICSHGLGGSKETLTVREFSKKLNLRKLIFHQMIIKNQEIIHLHYKIVYMIFNQ